MRNALVFLLLLVAGSVQAQFRLASDGFASLQTTVNDSTYVVDVTLFSDLTGSGYSPTNIQVGFFVFSQREQVYRVSAVSNLTFGGGTLTIIEQDINGINTEGAPIGQVMVYDPPASGKIPQVPFGSTGATSALQAAVVSYNSRVNGGTGSGLTDPAVRAITSDSVSLERSARIAADQAEANARQQAILDTAAAVRADINWDSLPGIPDTFGQYSTSLGIKADVVDRVPSFSVDFSELPYAETVDENNFYLPVYSEIDTAQARVRVSDIPGTTYTTTQGLSLDGTNLSFGIPTARFGEVEHIITENRLLRGSNNTFGTWRLNWVIGGIRENNLFGSTVTNGYGQLFLTGQPIVGSTGGDWKNGKLNFMSGGQSGLQRAWQVTNSLSHLHTSGEFTTADIGSLAFVSGADGIDTADVINGTIENFPLRLRRSGVSIAPQIRTKHIRHQSDGTANGYIYTEYLVPDVLSVSVSSPQTLNEVTSAYGTPSPMSGSVPGGGQVYYEIFLATQGTNTGSSFSKYFVTWNTAGFFINPDYEGSSVSAPILVVNGGALQVRLRENVNTATVVAAVKRLGTSASSSLPTNEN